MLPRDGIREIRLSAETLANHKSFYSELAAAGILSHDMATDKRDLFTYIYRCAEQIWTTREVVNFYEHYGFKVSPHHGLTLMLRLQGLANEGH